MIKIDLFFRWLSKIDQRYKNTGPAGGKRNNIFIKMMLTLKSMVYLLLLFIQPKSKKKHILFIDSRAYRSNIQGESRNRFYHPLIQHLEEKHPEYDAVFLNDDNDYTGYPKDEKIVFSNKFYHAIKLLFVFKKT